MTTQEAGTESIGDQLARGRQEARRFRDDASDIAADLRLLAQKELALARAEIGEQVSFSTRSLALGGVAALFALLTTVFVALTVMFVLDTFMPLWAAALITTLLLAAGAGMGAMLAYQQFKRISIMPGRTMRSLREDVTWVKSQMNLSAK